MLTLRCRMITCIREMIEHNRDREWRHRHIAQADTWWEFERNNLKHLRPSRQEIINMTNRKSEFIDITLDSVQKKAVKANAESYEWVSETLMDSIVRGYRVSISPDTRNKCYMCTIAPVSTKENKGLLVTSRAKAPIHALAATLYKVSEIKEWGSWGESRGDDDDWLE